MYNYVTYHKDLPNPDSTRNATAVTTEAVCLKLFVVGFLAIIICHVCCPWMQFLKNENFFQAFVRPIKFL